MHSKVQDHSQMESYIKWDTETQYTEGTYLREQVAYQYSDYYTFGQQNYSHKAHLPKTEIFEEKGSAQKNDENLAY